MVDLPDPLNPVIQKTLGSDCFVRYDRLMR